jgi:hypothetical protein
MDISVQVEKDDDGLADVSPDEEESIENGELRKATDADEAGAPTITEPPGEVVTVPPQETHTIIQARFSYYVFPDELASHYDREGNLTDGQMTSDGPPLRARDLYVLNKINEVIGSEVDPAAPAFQWPDHLRLPADADREAIYSKWICSGALMTERDDYLLDTLTDIKRGTFNPQETPVWFTGALVSWYDSSTNYADSQCFSDGRLTDDPPYKGTPMESRDRFLRQIMNSMSFVEVPKE